MGLLFISYLPVKISTNALVTVVLIGQSPFFSNLVTGVHARERDASNGGHFRVSHVSLEGQRKKRDCT